MIIYDNIDQAIKLMSILVIQSTLLHFNVIEQSQSYSDKQLHDIEAYGDSGGHVKTKL